MRSWMDTHTPPTDASIAIAKELDSYHGQIPKECDLADVVTDDPAISTPISLPEQPVIRRKGVDFEAIKIIALRSIAIFTSASCAITSVYFSNKWFVDSQPAAIAAIMSITVVLTLTVAPELSVSLAKKKRFVTTAVVMAIWMVATVFSMSSTVGGIYNARSKAIASSISSIAPADIASEAQAQEVALLKSKIERLSKSMDTDQAAVKSYQGEIDKALQDGRDQTSREVQVLVSNRNSALARVRSGELELSKAEEKIAGLLAGAAKVEASSSVKKRADFSQWLGDRLGMSGDQVEFILAVFPAIFIDIIAPTMLVVAFAL